MTYSEQVSWPQDFSLVQGGPLFQFFIRSHLVDNAMGWLKRRIGVFAFFTWVPLLLLSLSSGQAMKGSVQVPFFYDLEVHVRFLVVLPLLLVTEWVVHGRLPPVVRQFIERGIITPDNRPRFENAMASALRLRNSMLIESLMIILVFTLGHSIFFEQIPLNASNWYVNPDASPMQLSPAGYWLAYFSLPVYQFILLRWVFRILVWAYFLWRVAGIDLYLLPTHPDRAGGLGFLSQSTAAFQPFLLSQGALLSAMIGQRILHDGAALLDFKLEIGTISLFFLLLVVGPLCVFCPQLAKAKREGLRAYGILASRYVREFHQKWLCGGAGQDEAFIGSGDIQSLADLNNSFEVVRTMQFVPFGKQTVLQLVMVTLSPLLPLLLTILPLEDLLKRLIGILL